MTTIVSVRRNGQVVVGGDGQVSLGNTVMKGNARKVRRLYNGKVLAGFAGGTADAFTLFELFERKLESRAFVKSRGGISQRLANRSSVTQIRSDADCGG